MYKILTQNCYFLAYPPKKETCQVNKSLSVASKCGHVMKKT